MGHSFRVHMCYYFPPEVRDRLPQAFIPRLSYASSKELPTIIESEVFGLALISLLCSMSERLGEIADTESNVPDGAADAKGDCDEEYDDDVVEAEQDEVVREKNRSERLRGGKKRVYVSEDDEDLPEEEVEDNVIVASMRYKLMRTNSNYLRNKYDRVADIKFGDIVVVGRKTKMIKKIIFIMRDVELLLKWGWNYTKVWEKEVKNNLILAKSRRWSVELWLVDPQAHGPDRASMRETDIRIMRRIVGAFSELRMFVDVESAALALNGLKDSCDGDCSVKEDEYLQMRFEKYELTEEEKIHWSQQPRGRHNFRSASAPVTLADLKPP